MTIDKRLRAITLALICVGASWGTSGQPAVTEPESWREADLRLPERVRLDRVVTFDLDKGSSLTFGIEPDTLRIDADGVVRYAFVARSSSGAINVLYEGIRCLTGEVRLYAHWDPGSGWTPVADSAWQPLSFRGSTRRAMQMARGGVCDHRTPNGPPARILEALRSGTRDQTR